MNHASQRRHRLCATLVAPVLISLAGCEAERTAPVALEVPGLPSPERALQEALDRTHGFMASLNERIATPARQDLPLSTTNIYHGGPLVLHPAGPDNRAAPGGASHGEATPRFLRSGASWFGYADGPPRIHCRPGQICVVTLQAGERIEDNSLETDRAAGWSVTIVKGTRGVHASWAVALTPHIEATPAVLHIATTKRHYTLVLDPTGDTMQAVRFLYERDDPDTQPEPPADATRSNALPSLSRNSPPAGAPDFDFVISGANPVWRPLRIYRQGSRTYIQFPPGAIVARPRLVVLAPGGGKTGDYRTVGDSYVIDQRIEDALLIGAEPDAPSVRLTHRRAP
ncbi:TrbG/VirB9 family P-type conjugative transfer protein [Asaia spathodeae]|uniref:TrbG/VirB9 family P-type conjugative transfer protein n=1 Tax=Asaia spathodeae TaxID=657016 RepID=UPI00367040E4